MDRNFKVCARKPGILFSLARSNKLQGTFADGHLTDALINIANDSNTDKRVKKKLILVLASWRDQFGSDPSMALVAGLYKQCRGGGNLGRIDQDVTDMWGSQPTPGEKKRVDKEEKRKKEKQERAMTAQDRSKKKRAPFEFEKVSLQIAFCNCVLIHPSKEKPKILASIVDGSQASSNLVNAITVSILLDFCNLFVIICLIPIVGEQSK